MNRKEKIEFLKKASEAYYTGDPIISDEEYDNLCSELNYKEVGYATQDPRKISHGLENSLGSLDKIKYPSKIPFSDFIITPKYDGITGAVDIFDGEVVLSATRGDGFYGIDITEKVKIIFQKYNINKKGYLKIKGEFVCNNENFESIKDRFSHPRNFVAGTLNSKEIDEDLLKKISFIPYGILKSEWPFGTKKRVLEELYSIGFEKVPYIVSSNLSDLLNFYEENRKITPLDGLVITELYLKDPHNLDYSGSEKSIAYKFQGESAETVLTSIEWSVGPFKVTPIAEFEPVQLSGATISRASLYNYGNVSVNEIGPGSIISVTRSNEVIPVVEKVIEKRKFWFLSVPKNCPLCESELAVRGVELVCDNALCPAKNKFRQKRAFEVFGIPHGLADAGLDQYITLLRLDKIEDTVDLIKYTDNEDFYKRNLGNHIGSLCHKLSRNASEKIKNGFTVSEFWYILSIPGVSTEISKRLPKFDESISKENFEKKLIDLRIPSNVLRSVMNNYPLIEKVHSIIDYLEEEYSEALDERIPTCISGKVGVGTKNQFFDKYKNFIYEAPVNKCSLLITNSNSSSKYKYAKKHDIKIMNENEFYDYVR